MMLRYNLRGYLADVLYYLIQSVFLLLLKRDQEYYVFNYEHFD